MTTSTFTAEPMWVDSITPTPITCQPWCLDGDGHPGATFVDDQWCHGRERRVPLSLEAPVLLADETREPEYVMVHAGKYPGEEPRVHLDKGEMPVAQLLPDEAESLARQLLIVAAQIHDAARAGVVR